MASFVSNKLIEYNFAEFESYIEKIKKACDDKDKNMVNTINKNLERNWTNIEGNIRKISDVCIENVGRFYTGTDSTQSFLQQHTNKQSNISIPYIPRCSNQVVFGISEDIAPYFFYNTDTTTQAFLISSDRHWSEEKNNLFLRCSMMSQYNECEYPVRFLLPKDVNRLFNNKNEPRITIYELFTLHKILVEDNRNTSEDYNKLKNNLWIDTTSNDNHDILLIKNPYYLIKNLYYTNRGGKKQINKPTKLKTFHTKIKKVKNKISKRKTINKKKNYQQKEKLSTKRKTINKTKRLIS